jgi:plastocyanin domain-containing protein
LILGQQNPELKAPAYTIKTNQLPKLEQPISLKLAVIAVGFGLISTELWWFMFSKAK